MAHLVKIIGKPYVEFIYDGEGKRCYKTLELESLSPIDLEIKLKTTNPQVYTADRSIYYIQPPQKRITIQLLAIDPDPITPRNNNQIAVDNHKITLNIVLTRKQSSQIQTSALNFNTYKSEIIKSQFMSQYQKKNDVDQTIDQNIYYKEQFEELLIKTDEQEKELFQLSELKNRLSRKINKQKVNYETQKNQEFNTVHIGYAIIIIVLSFIIGLFIRD